MLETALYCGAIVFFGISIIFSTIFDLRCFSLKRRLLKALDKFNNDDSNQEKMG